MRGLPSARAASPCSIPNIRLGTSASGDRRLNLARDIWRRRGRRGLRRIDDRHIVVRRRRVVDPLGPGGDGHEQRDRGQTETLHEVSPDQKRQGGDHRSFTVAHGSLGLLPFHGNELAISPNALGRCPAGQRARRQIPDRRGAGCLGRLGLFCGCRGDNAGAGQISLVLDPLRKRRLRQKSQKRECH